MASFHPGNDGIWSSGRLISSLWFETDKRMACRLPASVSISSAWLNHGFVHFAIDARVGFFKLPVGQADVSKALSPSEEARISLVSGNQFLGEAPRWSGPRCGSGLGGRRNRRWSPSMVALRQIEMSPKKRRGVGWWSPPHLPSHETFIIGILNWGKLSADHDVPASFVYNATAEITKMNNKLSAWNPVWLALFLQAGYGDIHRLQSAGVLVDMWKEKFASSLSFSSTIYSFLRRFISSPDKCRLALPLEVTVQGHYIML